MPGQSSRGSDNVLGNDDSSLKPFSDHEVERAVTRVLERVTLGHGSSASAPSCPPRDGAAGPPR